jgi:hypothetical protein
MSIMSPGYTAHPREKKSGLWLEIAQQIEVKASVGL